MFQSLVYFPPPNLSHTLGYYFIIIKFSSKFFYFRQYRNGLVCSEKVIRHDFSSANNFPFFYRKIFEGTKTNGYQVDDDQIRWICSVCYNCTYNSCIFFSGDQRHVRHLFLVVEDHSVSVWIFSNNLLYIFCFNFFRY